MDDHKNRKEEEEIENSDDFVIEDEEEIANPQNLIKNLRVKLKQSETEKKDYLESLQKSKAEFANLRKKDEERFEELKKFASEDVLRDILPILDSFEMAMENKNLSSTVPKEWLMGFEGIYNQLISLLERNNVKKISPMGELFNPREHEAMAIIDTTKEKEDGVVLEVLQSGYKFYDKILRTAKVKVGSSGHK